jgi:integrase
MRPLWKLTDIQVRTADIGVHGDGGGLVLSVKRGATGLNRSWLFRYSWGGRAHWMGLGSYPDVSLSRAREKAQDARRLLSDGIDPLTVKRDQRASLRREQAKHHIPTFDECRDAYVTNHRHGWRSVRHAHDWVKSLKMHVTPIFGSTPVDMIDTALVCKALEPIWLTTTETASRVRGRIEAVLNWAQTRGYRGTDLNPARWKGHLANILPARSRVAAVEHHAAMPYSAVPAFVATLRQHKDVRAFALEFLVLTAGRANEVLGARWEEIDLAARKWTIPADRMKSGKEHQVPLSPSAAAVLKKLSGDGEVVFRGENRSSISDNSLRKWAQAIGCQFTVHGFRSSFRDWAAERTNYPSEVAEMALAHRVGSHVENAYRRTDMFERRRRLMADWAAFCEIATVDAEVIPIRAVM